MTALQRGWLSIFIAVMFSGLIICGIGAGIYCFPLFVIGNVLVAASVIPGCWWVWVTLR